MMKKLAEMFCPSGEKLAVYAAKGIQKSLNSSLDGKEDARAKVAQIAALAKSATELANNLSSMLEDGRLDDMETEMLTIILTPLCYKARALVFG